MIFVSGLFRYGQIQDLLRDLYGEVILVNDLAAAGDKPGILNAKMPPELMRRHCQLSDDASAMMRMAFEKLGFSARAHDRVLRVARTIADLAGSAEIQMDHLAEAIMYRSLERKYWKG